MKIIVEQEYYENGFTHYPLVTYDEDLSIDERKVIRVGTFSVIDGAIPNEIFNGLAKHFA